VKVGLDTSVVLRLLVGRPEGQTRRAVALLDDLARHGDEAVVSDLVVAETYFALQYHYGVPKARALSALHQLFAAGEIAPQGTAAAVLATPGLAAAKPGFVDRLIHGAYVTAAQGRMATFERAAAKLGSVLVLRS
jgi:predicted nucleic acid-binding protein